MASSIGRFEDDLHIKSTVFINGELSNTKLRGRASCGKPRKSALNHYMCDLELINEYEKNMVALSIDEASVQDTAQALIPEYSIEVRVGYKIGSADLMSEFAIVEIKKFLEWKHALGQILAYAHEHPNKKKYLLLFKDKINPKQLDEAVSVCKSYGVNIETIEGAECANKWLQRTKLRCA